MRNKVIHTKTLILDHKSLNQKKNYHILVNVSIYEKITCQPEHKYDSMSLHGFISDIKIIVMNYKCFKIIVINYREKEQKLLRDRFWYGDRYILSSKHTLHITYANIMSS